MAEILIWFPNKAVDQIAWELNEYGKKRREFTNIFAVEEERLIGATTLQGQQQNIHDNKRATTRLSIIVDPPWYWSPRFFETAIKDVQDKQQYGVQASEDSLLWPVEIFH
ncbi:hypothetical protein PRK78_000193 [Emydomyces testavorans]|uniref:Uncharacterized protein n=1 Tax=Emydomyces testavorans TaxID=2070801 RepID=A0AAF0DAN9_9EURO|nr:hypothetical protein PRK78_000193 [Emydomyces testavorans]